jgi:rhamnosyl/mannosyltransferase
MLQRYRDKVAVIPGGIDTARFVPTAQTRLEARALRRALAPEGPVVLYVGRLVYYKGVEYLLRAMREVRATLLIVGRGGLLGALKTLARRLGVHTRTHFLSDVGAAELPLYYQASDLLVLPSCEPTETFGLVQVEAHASGIPSICTALGTGVTFANLDGVSGLVVPPRDSDGLAAAVNRLLRDDALRERLGRQAQQRALALFDVRRCASEVVELYRALACPQHSMAV